MCHPPHIVQRGRQQAEKEGRGTSKTGGRGRDRAEKENTAEVSHHFWPDFFLLLLLLSSLCPSCLWGWSFSFLELSSCVFTSLLWKLLPPLSVLLLEECAKRGRERERVGMCSWTACEPSRVKVSDCSGLWLLPLSTRQTQLICSPCVERPHPLIAPHTLITPCMCLTLLDWVCLCVVDALFLSLA